MVHEQETCHTARKDRFYRISPQTTINKQTNKQAHQMAQQHVITPPPCVVTVALQCIENIFKGHEITNSFAADIRNSWSLLKDDP